MIACHKKEIPHDLSQARKNNLRIQEEGRKMDGHCAKDHWCGAVVSVPA